MDYLSRYVNRWATNRRVMAKPNLLTQPKPKPKRRRKLSRIDRAFSNAKKNNDHYAIETAVIVPSTANTRRKGEKYIRKITPAEFKKRVTDTRRGLSKIYGGYTSVSSVGGYYDKDKKILVKERGAVVTSYATESAYKRKKNRWIKWVQNKRKVWKQDSVGVIVENDLYYVK